MEFPRYPAHYCAPLIRQFTTGRMGSFLTIKGFSITFLFESLVVLYNFQTEQNTNVRSIGDSGVKLRRMYLSVSCIARGTPSSYPGHIIARKVEFLHLYPLTAQFYLDLAKLTWLSEIAVVQENRDRWACSPEVHFIIIYFIRVCYYYMRNVYCTTLRNSNAI